MDILALAVGAGLALIGLVTLAGWRYICLFPFSNGIDHRFLGGGTLAFGAIFIFIALAEILAGALHIVAIVMIGVSVVTSLGCLTAGNFYPMEDAE